MGVALVTLQELLATELENLSRFARVLTGDREQAHDVLFDVLEKAQRGWPRIAELHAEDGFEPVFG
jgi:DNA-directed RNA polymerase specialized sigma24 family protein